MFAQTEWMAWMTDAGFRATVHRADVADAPEGYTMFVGVRPIA